MTPFERGIAEFVVATIDRSGSYPLETGRLVELGAPRGLLDNIVRGAGCWSVCDDDRLDVLVAHVARLARTCVGADERDVRRLRSVGFTDIDMLDLNGVVFAGRSCEDQGAA